MEIEGYIVATDAELVELSSKGDHQAFEYLFTRYREAIRRLFEQRLGDRDTAEDLVQETFIKVYLHLKNYSSAFTFGQWVYTIARNTLVDYLRRRTDDVSIDDGYRAPQAMTMGRKHPHPDNGRNCRCAQRRDRRCTSALHQRRS